MTYNKRNHLEENPGDAVYTKPLLPNEWAAHYNISQVKHLVNSIKKHEYYVQTLEILKIAQPGEKILEIGSGTGQTSLALASKGCIVTALDFEQQCLDLTGTAAADMCIAVRLVCADATKPLPFETDEFDVIFHAGLMEHFIKEDRIKMFKAWRRYGKKMVSMVPNAASIAYREGKAIMEKNGTWSYGLELPIYSQIHEFMASGWMFEKEYTIGLEHALNFLDTESSLRKELHNWINNKHTEDDVGQGYLLVTLGTKPDVQ